MSWRRADGRSAPLHVRIANPLAAQFQHFGGDGGDAGIDPGAGVEVQVAPVLEILQLDQRLLRPPVQVGGLGIGFAGPGRVAGQFAKPRSEPIEAVLTTAPPKAGDRTNRV